MRDRDPRHRQRSPAGMLWLLVPLCAAFFSAPATSQEAVTVEDCAACHEDQVAAFAGNPHSVLDALGWASRAGADFSCTACHGDVAAHMDEGGGQGNIFAFGAGESPRAVADRCLACHADTHPRFAQSPHAQDGMSCVSCHSIHSSAGGKLLQASTDPDPFERSTPEARMCQQCHQDVAADFTFNERHRLEEGILDCTSCHDPHEPPTRMQLGAFKQELCVQCHTDKGGPFVFEHGSVMVEGCVACHTPHGSANRHLLTFQSRAELCFSCHAVVPSFHSRFTLETQCTNCHSSIHGSNFSPFFLK